MLRQAAVVTVALAVLAGPAVGLEQCIGTSVPKPDNPYRFSALATDASGRLYLCDDDTVYRFDVATRAFVTVVSGISSSTGVEIDPSTLAVTPDGTMAYVAAGYSGCVVEVDLVGGTSRDLPGAIAPVSNIGIATDPVHGMVFVTDSYTQQLDRVETAGDGSLVYLDNFGDTAAFGGGIAFTPGGELIVPVPVGYAAWPADDNFPVDLYRFSRAWLDDLADGTVTEDAGQLYASGVSVSGSNAMAADKRGNAYLWAVDAIYAVDSAGQTTALVGAPGLNAFDMIGYGYMAIAYDAVQDRLLYAYTDSPAEDYVLYQYLLGDEIVPGDCDRDGDVDAADLAALGLAWGPSADDRLWQQGNFGANGNVDAVDLAALGLNWNPDGTGAPAPEPATLALVAAGAVAMAAARQRRA